MKWIWILVYYNLKGFEVKTFYFTSERKAKKFAKEKESPATSVRCEIFPVEIY